MRRVWMSAFLGAALAAAGCPQPAGPTPGDSHSSTTQPVSRPAARVATPPATPAIHPVIPVVPVASVAPAAPAAPPVVKKPEAPARAGPHRPLSAQEETELLAAVKKFHEPDYQRLSELKAKDLAQYRTQMRLMWIWYGEWKTLPAPVQQAYWSLREARADTAAALAGLKDEKDPALRKSLQTSLRQGQGREFDALQVIQTQWAAEFAQRIDKLQVEIDIRRKNLEKMRGELKARQLDREKILDGKVDLLQKNPPPAQPEF